RCSRIASQDAPFEIGTGQPVEGQQVVAQGLFGIRALLLQCVHFVFAKPVAVACADSLGSFGSGDPSVTQRGPGRASDNRPKGRDGTARFTGSAVPKGSASILYHAIYLP